MTRLRSFHWVAIVLTAIVIVLLVFGTLLVKWPFTEAATVKTLEARSGRKVTIGAFKKTYFPPGFIASNIQFLRHDHPEKEPLIRLDKLVLQGSWAKLVTFNHSIPEVDVYRMRLSIPARAISKDGKHHELLPLTSGKSNLSLNRIRVHGATLDFLPGQAEGEPFQLEVRDLTLSGVGNNQAFGFDAVVENPVPRGEIHGKGTFGPWSADEPSATPVQGAFTFQNARLSDIPGITGTLQSQGKFQGTLDHVETDGDATVPDFRVVTSTHTENLHAVFHTAVDATAGNVLLEQLDATFGHTTIHAQGSISGEEHRKGKTAVLHASVSDGRVEDLAKMFIKSKESPLNGQIALQTSIRLPSGPAKFLERLEMTGKFHTASGHFSNAQTQGLLNRLKESAHGENKKQQETNAESVSSRMRSNVIVKGGVAHITDLLLEAPDTLARMDGTFNLLSKEINLSGTLKTDGKLSDTQTGFKAFAVKMITPFLKKEKATIVPFEMKGTYGSVSARLDLDGKRKL